MARGRHTLSTKVPHVLPSLLTCVALGLVYYDVDRLCNKWTNVYPYLTTLQRKARTSVWTAVSLAAQSAS